ncbi:hypothetical protein QUA41_18900 [Microcoleus sp. Pol11C1]|uniref:hypothetical protein n=1 Tax=unclassified Microcoleus TaxID=2642155 RepID=UPI002FD0BE8D
MESNNLFSQELPSESSAITESESDNSTNQELNELELDAIAGGMRVITASGPKPDFLRFGGPSFQITEKTLSYNWGQKQ